MAHPRYSKEKIAKTIDHSLLKPEMTRAQVAEGCEIARHYAVASVCCKPSDVAFCAELLRGSDVEVGTVVGFPTAPQRQKRRYLRLNKLYKTGPLRLIWY